MATNKEHDIEAGQLNHDTQERYLELYKAAMNGDWRVAASIYEDHPEDITAYITDRNETALHVAAGFEQDHNRFVEILVESMSREDLARRDTAGRTALFPAAVAGKVIVAAMMLRKNRDLVMMPMNSEFSARLPIHYAALHGRRKMVYYLYSVTEIDALKLFFRNNQQDYPLRDLIDAEIYDVALDILKQCADIAFSTNWVAEASLRLLAQKPQMSSSETIQYTGPRIWNRLLNLCFTEEQRTSTKQDQALELVSYIWDKEYSKRRGDRAEENQFEIAPILSIAAEQGNVDFLKVLIGLNPSLLFHPVETRDHIIDGLFHSFLTLFHIAIVHRQEQVFKLIHKLGSYKNALLKFKDDTRSNNLLHLAAILLPAKRLNVIPGAALQLQFELIWFEEVKKAVEPSLIKEENEDKKTPEDLFIEQHKELRDKGEEWMKATANSCMLVATLIATVAFAAAFTVPGGTNDSGIPVLMKKTSFKMFAIFDAVTLIASASSILNFLSILTARYTVHDFLWSLPNRLLIGLVSLFVSVVGMMVAFTATLFLLLEQGLPGIVVPVAALAIIPVTLFILQHFRLLYDVVNSIYLSTSLFKPSKEPLFRTRLKRKDTAQAAKTSKSA